MQFRNQMFFSSIFETIFNFPVNVKLRIGDFCLLVGFLCFGTLQISHGD